MDQPERRLHLTEFLDRIRTAENADELNAFGKAWLCALRNEPDEDFSLHRTEENWSEQLQCWRFLCGLAEHHPEVFTEDGEVSHEGDGDTVVH